MKGFSPVLCTLLIISCARGVKEPFITGMENKPLVGFNIQLADSSFFNTAKFTSGKKVMLFYYSPNCPYCRAQMREILNNLDQYKDVQLCAITGAHFKLMKDFTNYFKLNNYPQIITGRDTGYIILRKYKALSVPFTAFFDQDKKLSIAYRGRITGKTLFRGSLQ